MTVNKTRKILFVRHGQTDWNAQGRFQGSNDIPLNERGRGQARGLMQRLVHDKRHFEAVYTSPLTRAEETARIIAEGLNCPCRVKDGFRELGLGEWEGITWEQAEKRDPELFSLWNTRKRTTRPPNGENYVDLLERLVPDLMSALNETREDILVVAHSACIHALLAECYHTPYETMFKDYNVPNTGGYTVLARDVLRRWGKDR
jgi:Fructose-2,6-bisphosphatase